MNEERLFMAIAKAAAYGIGLVVAVILLVRFGVLPLWGSGSTLGVIAAPLLAAIGVLAITYLAIRAVRDVFDGPQNKENDL